MARYILIFILVIWCITLPGVPMAETEPQIGLAKMFDEAAGYYGLELYDKAIAEYNSMLEKGLESGNIYYNLGNCYLKKKALGKAIVSYEKASRLMPRDSDLLFNLKYARSLIKQAKAPPGKSRLLDNLWNAADFLSAREMIILADLIYYFTVFLVAIFVLFKRSRIYIKYAIAFFAVMLLCALAWSAHKAEEIGQSAIVTSGIADAKFEPLEGAAANFPVYEGTKVNVLKEIGGWYKIKLSDAEVGWVRKDAVERIGM